MTGRRAAVYVRVSTGMQVEGTSLDDQERRCRAWCDLHGFDVAEVYREEGFTGSVASRPAVDRLLASVRAGDVEAVVVAKLDRLGRSARDLLNLLAELDDLDVTFASVAESIDSSTPVGRLLRTILAAVAEFERENILSRLSDGLLATARAGRWPGGPPPFGWKVAKRSDGGSVLEINDDEAAVIRLTTACLVDRRMSTHETAAVLNDRGLKPRRSPKWTYHNLRRLLLDAHSLSGTWTYRRNETTGETIDVPVPAILDAERHATLNSVLASTSTGPGATSKTREYLLSGRLHGACGAPMYGRHRKGNRSSQYFCEKSRSVHGDDRCRCRTCNVDLLDEVVWGEVERLLTDPAALASIAATRPIDTTNVDDDLAAIDRRVHRAEDALATRLVEYAELGLDAGAVRKATDQLSHDLERLRGDRDKVARWQTHNAEARDRRRRLWDLAGRASEALANLDIAGRRQILDLLDVNVNVRGWAECTHCEGRGLVSAGEVPRSRERGATGVPCPACARHRVVPVVEITGTVPESIPFVGDSEAAAACDGDAGLSFTLSNRPGHLA